MRSYVTLKVPIKMQTEQFFRLLQKRDFPGVLLNVLLGKVLDDVAVQTARDEEQELGKGLVIPETYGEEKFVQTIPGHPQEEGEDAGSSQNGTEDQPIVSGESERWDSSISSASLCP